MNWSIRITILYLGFVALILTLVFVSSSNKEELVASNYYEQELKFQDQIDAMNNANQLTESVQHQITADAVLFSVPKEFITKDFSGQVTFYCPSDSKKDASFKMKLNSQGEFTVLKNKIQHGIYKLKIGWQANQKHYFKEEVLTIR
jgi:nitrogen fixation protein FixH